MKCLCLSRCERRFPPPQVFIPGVFSKMSIGLFSVGCLAAPGCRGGSPSGCGRVPRSCAGRPPGSASLRPPLPSVALLTCLGAMNSSAGSGCAGSRAAFASRARSHARCGLRGQAQLICARTIICARSFLLSDSF